MLAAGDLTLSQTAAVVRLLQRNVVERRRVKLVQELLRRGVTLVTGVWGWEGRREGGRWE